MGIGLAVANVRVHSLFGGFVWMVGWLDDLMKVKVNEVLVKMVNFGPAIDEVWIRSKLRFTNFDPRATRMVDYHLF